MTPQEKADIRDAAEMLGWMWKVVIELAKDEKLTPMTRWSLLRWKPRLRKLSHKLRAIVPLKGDKTYGRRDSKAGEGKTAARDDGRKGRDAHAISGGAIAGADRKGFRQIIPVRPTRRAVIPGRNDTAKRGFKTGQKDIAKKG
jgi:hypothetical protein